MVVSGLLGVELDESQDVVVGGSQDVVVSGTQLVVVVESSLGHVVEDGDGAGASVVVSGGDRGGASVVAWELPLHGGGAGGGVVCLHG